MDFCLKDIKKVLAALLMGGAAGLMLLLFVYSIPVDRILVNARASIEIFEKEGATPQTVVGYEATTLDNYTDAWMLRNAFYDGEESVFQKSLNVYYYGYQDGKNRNVCESMIDYLNGVEGYHRRSYARYWHGYLILLKPLLCFFDYGDIRGILKLTELSLLIYLCMLLERKKMARVLPALAVMMFCIGFYEIGQSMQYSWVFLIAVTASIFILKKYPVMDGKMVFLIIGMCTSFFDFLTYPLFTLGMPLVILLLCMAVSEEKKGTVKVVVLNSVFWGIGYFGFWAEKWILGTLLTEENILVEALGSIIERTGRSVVDQPIGYVETVLENIGILCKWPYVLAVLGGLALIFAGMRKECLKVSKELTAAYLLVAVFPFIWYAAAMNHSYLHSFMTYRDLGVSIFAGLSMIISMREIKRNEQKET